MCGIAGLFDTKEPSSVDRGLLRRMTDAIAHRGPDGEGFHFAPGIGLGHRRLAIIDLAGGAQPMHHQDGTLTVVFNGEIYNYAELAAELVSLGHVFRTSSDTEVIIHAWRAWGQAAVARLKGMFAFALWDARTQSLVLARDPIGKKPLYYAISGQHLSFASEIKALLVDPRIDRQMRSDAVADYFAYGYVPDPKTIYRDIFKLAPGHSLTCRRGQPPVISAFWEIDLSQSPRAIDSASAATETLERLRHAVAKRLIADVPLGAFLSGGVDSSGVVAVMAGLTNVPVKTCTIGFGENSHDEREYARQIAARYHTDHEEFVVAPDEVASEEHSLDRIASIYDEPFADNSALPMDRICAIARQRVTVAVSGDGGDEGFAGYRRYRWHVREAGFRRAIPQAVRGPLFSMMARLYPSLAWAPQMFRAKSTLRELSLNAVDAYFSNVAVMQEPVWKGLITERFNTQLQGYRARDVLGDLMGKVPTDDPLLQAQYADMKTWLAGRMLVKVDRASMAHGLEIRSPFLDVDLFAWALTLPAELKLVGGNYKSVLKKALEPLVPRELLYRSKQGFGVPMAAWLRGPLKEAMAAAVSSQRLHDSGIFEPAALRALFDRHLAGHGDHNASLWAVLMFDRFLARNATWR